MDDQFTLEDIAIIIRRRFLAFLAPTVAVLIVGLAGVALLPAKYTASGTILVVGAEIPSSFVQTIGEDYAERRINTIRQRVLNRQEVLRIADKYDLYPRRRGYQDSTRVAKIRENLSVNLITSGNNYGNRDNTIAFTLSYSDASPDKAFQATNEFMSLFLTQDAEVRAAGASSTTDFIKTQKEKFAAEIQKRDNAIAKFKSENADALPETLDQRKQSLDRAREELRTTELTLSSTEDELRFIENQLAAGAPSSELAAKRAELAQLRAVYTETHPGIVVLKREIAALQNGAGDSGMRKRQEDLARANNDLKKLTASADAPAEAIAAKTREISALENALAEAVARLNTSGDVAATQLQSRYALSLSRLTAMSTQRETLRQNIKDMEANIARTPSVALQLSALMRDYDAVHDQYRDITEKENAAELSESVETSRKGEKFSILDAAVRPEHPSSPNRVKLSILALFASLAAGVGAVVAAEFLAGTVRGSAHLAKLLDTHPIAVIPYILDGQESARTSLPMLPLGKKHKPDKATPELIDA